MQVVEFCPGIYLEGWLAYLTELRISDDHPMWTKATPEVELLDSPEPYLPFILIGFNEEKYLNQPIEEDGEEDATGKSVKLSSATVG